MSTLAIPQPKLWVPGDWNGFFGLFTNVLLNIIVLSMRPSFQGWEEPWLFFLSLGIVLVSWTANVKLPFNVPGGLAAVLIGTLLAWGAKFLHVDELMQPSEVTGALHLIGLHLP